MSETIEDVVRQVVAAMGHARADDVVEGVKTAVANSVRRADPSARIRFTSYFNHTYNPDMHVSWSKGDVGDRPVFLRGSLSAAVAADDLPDLSDQAPIVIGLKPEKKRVLNALRPRMRRAGASLAAEVSAVAALSTLQPSAERTSSASLSALLRSSVLRQGQGFLDTRGVARIADVDRRAGADAARALRETVDELLPGAVGSRLSATAALLGDVFNKADAEAVAERLIARPMSEAELGVVLPRMLAADADQVDGRVWHALATSLTLAQLEGLSGALVDQDLTPLVVPAVRRMGGFRAQLALNANLVEEEETGSISEIARWRMRGSLLAAEMGNQVLFVVSDGRKLKVPGDGVDARLDELGLYLDGLELRGVALHGLSDQFDVASEDPSRVATLVDQVRGAIRDDFHVPQIRVREVDPELDGVLKVEFGLMRAERVSGAVSIRAFVLTASMLGRRDPIPARLIRRLLGEADEATE